MRDKATKSNTKTPAAAEPAEIVRLSVAQVRANFRRVLDEKRPVFIERHGFVVGCLIPLEWRRSGTDAEKQAEFSRALDRLRNALHTLTKE